MAKVELSPLEKTTSTIDVIGKRPESQAHGVFLILRGEAVQHDAQRGNLTGPVLAMNGPVGSPSRSFHLVHEQGIVIGIVGNKPTRDTPDSSFGKSANIWT